MVDITKSLFSAGTFLVGYFLCLISQYLIPSLIGVVDGTTLMSTDAISTVSRISWLALIMFWLLALVIIPIAMAVWGITTPTENTSPVMAATGSIFYFVFAVLLTWAIYYWVSPMLQALQYTPLKAMFWIGLIGVWLINTLIVPIMGISEARQV